MPGAKGRVGEMVLHFVSGHYSTNCLFLGVILNSRCYWRRNSVGKWIFCT